MRQHVLSYGAVADKISAGVEEEFGGKVKHSAIVMALRRHSERESQKEPGKKFDWNSEIIMKTGLTYLSFSKVPGVLEKLEKIYKKINPEKDTFNVIHGNYEIAVITNDKHSSIVKEIFGSSNLKAEAKDLVSLSVTFGKDFAYTPGIIFAITRNLYWANVNIFEMVTTSTELTFLFQQKNAVKAYHVVHEMVK